MKILICDDHKIVRDGLRQILSQLDDVELIGEAASGSEALEILKEVFFNILLLDITMPGISGLEVLEIVRERHPLLHVLMLSMHTQEQYALRALKLGASGYLTKDTASEELLLAVRKVMKDGKYISEALADSIAQKFDNDNKKQKHELLSDREFNVMIKLAEGRSLQEISSEYFVSKNAISTYRARILKKMNLTTNNELTKYCFENKLIL